jgi:hypothetical protein
MNGERPEGGYHMKTQPMLAVALAIGLIASARCRDEEQPAPEARAKMKLEEMREEILERVGQAPCSDDRHCRAIGFGSKPCGGPWSYLIYSTQNLDTAELVERVRTYNAFEDSLNKRFGYTSDCSIPAEPTPRCIEGRCREAEGR